MKLSLYILFGVIPVSMWAIFIPLASLVAFPIGLCMILGTVGMYRATFQKKSTSKSTAVNCVLLLFGQFVVLMWVVGDSFGPLKSIPNRPFEYMVFFGVLGPMLVCLHYQIDFIAKKTSNKFSLPRP